MSLAVDSPSDGSQRLKVAGVSNARAPTRPLLAVSARRESGSLVSGKTLVYTGRETIKEWGFTTRTSTLLRLYDDDKQQDQEYTVYDTLGLQLQTGTTVLNT